MFNFLNAISSVSGFIPHGHCYLWKPELVGLHLISDALIALSYFSISVTLIYLIRRIQVPFDGVFLAFGTFIAACGATHLMEVWTLWHPNYWVSGEIKAITAIASLSTAIILPPLMPQVASLVNNARLSEERQLQLETTNRELGAVYEQLTQLDQAKTRFFANVSHELRTPLTLILGFAERLLENKELPAKQHQDIGTINSNARILLNYVNDLLDIARLEADKLELRYTSVDVAKLVSFIVGSFDAIAQERQITVTVDGADSLVIAADREKLQRVLLNLFSNAFKFTPAGGIVRCTLQTDEDSVRVVLDDTGPGVPPELRQRIFERFQQGDRPYVREQGTGLGLTISREFVELHQGRISVTDAPEGGARFTIELPLHAPAAAVLAPETEESIDFEQDVAPLLSLVRSSVAESPEGEETAPADRPLVLVVEDTRDMRLFIRESLKGDYRVSTAINGQQGLEKAIALRPDLILSDMKMPVMDGAQLVQQLRNYPALDDVPIVLLTARSDINLKVDLLRQGVQDYIVKPFSVAELRARISNLITVKQVQTDLFHANQQLQQEISDRLRIEAALRVSQESIQSLYEIVADSQLTFTTKMRKLLALGCDRFQLDLGILAEITGDRYEVEEVYLQEGSAIADSGLAIVPGDVFDLSQTYCQKTFYAQEPVCFEHAALSDEWKGHPCYQALHLESYIATPIQVLGERYGTLNFSSSHPRDRVFSLEEKKFLQLMAEWIGGEIARQQAEDRLRQSQKQLTTAQRIAHLGSWSFDVPSEKIHWSEETFRIFGFSADAGEPNLEQHLAQIHPDDLNTWQFFVNRALQEGIPYQFDFRIQHPNLGCRYITAWGEPVLDGAEQVACLFGTVMDITERKLAELEIRSLNTELEQRVADRTAQLEAANRLKDDLLRREQEARAEAESANQMKDEFLATLSHELRTPLNAILGWAQLLRTRRFDAETIEKALATIERNARSQNQLVGDILDVSRIIRGKLRLNCTPVNLSALLRTALDSVRPTAEAKDVDLTLSVISASTGFNSQPMMISGDSDRLQQIIWNLLSNAMKFTPSGGRVDVSLAEVDSNRVEIRVSDTGEGISPEFLPYVFDRFRQADGTISRPHGGLGLGLAIVRHLTELHGGTVWAESAGVGQGATFVVQLPILAPDIDDSMPEGDRQDDGLPASGQATAETTPISALPPALLAGLNILAVDDEPDAREFLTALLEQYGASVRSAASAREALDALMAETPHILISDIGMPEQDGYFLIRQVRAIAAEHDLHFPAIALTAYAGIEDRIKLLQAGFQMHVPKPVDPMELVTAIASLVASPQANV